MTSAVLFLFPALVALLILLFLVPSGSEEDPPVHQPPHREWLRQFRDRDFHWKPPRKP